MAARPKTNRARSLRKNATDAERLLWRALRELDIPVKIRRQHPIGRYVADFAIPALKLVIEIDGGQHATAGEMDEKRTRQLNRDSYYLIRWWRRPWG